MIGAGASITVDGIVEKESGITPPPPPVSVKVLIIGLVLVFVLGVVGVLLLRQAAPPEAPYGGPPAAMQEAPSADPAAGK